MSLSASQRARLGVFVTVGAVLIAAFVAIPLGFKLTNRQKAFHSFFEGESVSGLERGADIKFRGVPVGKVERISYNPRDLARVRVDLLVDHEFPVKQDMYAQIGGISITGIKHLELSGGGNDSPLLKEGSEIETRVSSMTAITGKAEEIVAKIEVLLNHLNNMTHPDSSVNTILHNVAGITDEAHQFIATVRPRVEDASGSFASIVHRVDSIAADVKAITAQTRDIMQGERFTSIMASVDSSAQSIKHVADDVSLIIRQSREDIMVAMENLREAVENANELTKILTENPSLLLRGEQQRERELP
jgi:phospholipid/cholesterol/gamma-HCH transport system substrate-binding protein